MIIIDGTKQEIFDRVVKHLAQQKKQSSNECGECLYRSPEGLKCAIGCLIPEEKYSPDMEFVAIESFIEKDKLQFTNPDSTSMLSLLNELQSCHDDSFDVEELQGYLRNAAEHHNLDPNSINLITEWSTYLDNRN